MCIFRDCIKLLPRLLVQLSVMSIAAQHFRWFLRNVMNSHNIDTIGHLKPDIVVVDQGVSLLTPPVRQIPDHISYTRVAKGLDLGIVQPELAYLGLRLPQHCVLDV